MRAGFWEALTHFDRGKVLPWMALRNAAGVVIPLVAGALAGNLGGGLIAAIGALNVSYSDGTDPYPHRARRMFLASSLCGLAVMASGLMGRYHGLAIPAAGVCAFAAGMMVAVSPTAGDIGSVTLLTFVIFSAVPMTPRDALLGGLTAFGGGVVQMVFALALWPVRRYGPERRTLASLYREMAQMAAVGSPATEAPPASGAASSAQTALQALSGDRSLEAERYLALLSQAERARLALVTLSRLRVRLARDAGMPEQAERVGQALTLAAEILQSVAEALLAERPAEVRGDCPGELRKLGEQLRDQSAEPMLRDARKQVEALAGQLRAALELAERIAPAGATEFERQETAQPWRLRLAGPLALLRANLRLDSAAFRHAVRLAVCVMVGSAVGRALDWRRSYWIPMTVAIVLKPDFTGTFTRGVLRVAGTLAGLVMATALFHLLAPGMAAKIALIGLFAYLLRCYGPANYGLLVTALTSLVVFLLAAEGLPPGEVMVERGLNTATGGVIALVAYALWPTWEHTQIADILAAMLDAYRRYFAAVGRSYLEPDERFTAELDAARVAGRLARSNAEASAVRLRSEPGAPAARVAALGAILANSHRFIHAVMSLEAGLTTSRAVPARAAFRVFARDVELTLYYLAAALRGSPMEAEQLPDLREDYQALEGSGDAGVERYALVNVEADRITNSLNTLSGEIYGWLKGGM